ncbi:hypothetical protein R1flu_018955 [Riccia fluitans]|uniref:Uncharacterized protein n=1 Tax=Riccia fluitans TaxID=41844 RepID=A0ABD1ZIC7_9MARC
MAGNQTQKIGKPMARRTCLREVNTTLQLGANAEPAEAVNNQTANSDSAPAPVFILPQVEASSDSVRGILPQEIAQLVLRISFIQEREQPPPEAVRQPQNILSPTQSEAQREGHTTAFQIPNSDRPMQRRRSTSVQTEDVIQVWEAWRKTKLQLHLNQQLLRALNESNAQHARLLDTVYEAQVKLIELMENSQELSQELTEKVLKDVHSSYQSIICALEAQVISLKHEVEVVGRTVAREEASDYITDFPGTSQQGPTCTDPVSAPHEQSRKRKIHASGDLPADEPK